MHPFSSPGKHQKPYGFPVFSGDREKVHLGTNGLTITDDAEQKKRLVSI